MTITLQAVNELIASLESAGELSIREQKFLKLAKAFKQLAAENVEAKKIISECREYFIAGVMNRIRPTNEGYLHMICDTFADETPATARIVAEAEARGVEKAIAHLEKKFSNIGVQIMNLQWLADSLREGGRQMSNRIPNFGWNRLKLATLTYEQLAELEEQVKAEHACKNGIHLFDKAGQRKLDALSWAVYNKQKAERAA